MSLDHGGYGILSDEFQQIIAERKLEQKEKVKKVIRDHVETKGNGNGDSPLELFPAELWEMILNELHDAKDHINVWKANSLFRKLDVGAFLLLILNLEAPHICSEHKDPCRCRPKDKKGTFAQHLRFRTLSKTMRSGIDMWYENNLLKILREGRNDGEIKVPSLVIGCSDQRMRKAIQHFCKEGAEKVFTRSLAIEFETFATTSDEECIYMDYESEHFKMFKHEAIQLLSCIGDQIWHFKFDFSEFQEDEYVYTKAIYICLTELISMMPNLKWIEMSIGVYEEYSGWRRETLDMNQLFRDHPFPRLEHLERISLRFNPGDSEYPQELHHVHEAMIKAYPHVKILDFAGELDINLNLLPPSEDLLPSLQLQSFALGGGDRNSFKCEEVMPFLNPNWPLKRIQFGADSVKDALNLLEKFPTLENVSLHLFDVSDFEDIPFLMLPNLTKFECEVCPRIKSMENIHFFFSLQFLLYSKKLKLLTWKYDLETYAEDKEYDNSNEIFCLGEKLRRHMVNHEKHEDMINFRAGMRDLKFSNIWDVFPELKVVKVGFEDDGDYSMKTYQRG